VIAAINEATGKIGKLEAQYTVGAQVWLEGKDLKLLYQSTKLAPKRYGPFKIIKEVSLVAYWLELPQTWGIHNVFHTLLLSPYHEMMQYGPNFSRPPPDIIEEEAEYKVEAIQNHWYVGHQKALQYLIKWWGYPKSDNTWEAATDVHALDIEKTYQQGQAVNKRLRAALTKDEATDHRRWLAKILGWGSNWLKQKKHT
jgi:hypothetical protein